ncbi:MAG: hypothetical protein F4X08_12885 [Gemmatimonadetes bacterium]|nr:hypothetical protein [Gemmatimonadota bacterium]MYD26696.1 hypothetical protein [Gemmatimonadota bacterium]MYJ00651.1 hypothetical protein [Gemmatimonadota bacterium]
MTIIAKGAEMNGSMDVEGNVRVDGTVHGDVKATEGVEVGKTGRIVGSSIESKTAVIHGYVESHLIVSQHILLGGKSTLVGDLNTKTLVIEEGAVFHGNSAMMDEPAESDRVSQAGRANQTDQADQADQKNQTDQVDGGDDAASGSSGTRYSYER